MAQAAPIGTLKSSGQITEFLVCDFCFPSDIAEADGVLYFTKSDPGLGRITTSGTVLTDVVPPNSLANGNGVAARGDDVYYAAFNTNSEPFGITVAPNGDPWYAELSADKTPVLQLR